MERKDRADLVVPVVLGSALFAFDWALAPAGPRHLAYCLSAETGLWVPTEFAHPLFTPLLRVLRPALSAFGSHGHILQGVQALNIAAAAAAAALLFSCVRRAGAGPATAFAAAAGFVLSKGIWLQHVRPMPYALAALAALGALALLLDPENRERAAGAAAGLSILLTIASISLLPAGVIFLLARPPGPRGRARAAVFVSTAALTVLAGYAAFFLFHGIDPRSLETGRLFRDVEQVGGSSIWSSRDPLKQIADLWAAIRWNFDAPLLAALAVCGVAGLRSPAGRAGRDAALLLGGTGAFYLLFFLINNTQNGFIAFAAVLLPAAAAFAHRSPAARTAVIAASLCLLVRAGLEGSELRLETGGPVRESEPEWIEARFISRFARPSDLVLVPYEPVPGFDYFAELPLLIASDRRTPLEARGPIALGAELEERIARSLARGKRVYFAEWDGPRPEPGAEWLFLRDPAEPEDPGRGRLFPEFLSRRFKIGRAMRSPYGHRYAPLAPKGRSEISASPSENPAPRSFLDPSWPVPNDRVKTLRAALREDPRDAFSAADLAAEFHRSGFPGISAALFGEVERAGPGSARYSLLRRRRIRLRTLFNAGMARFKRGDKAGALAAFDLALSLDPADPEILAARAVAGSSGGAGK